MRRNILEYSNELTVAQYQILKHFDSEIDVKQEVIDLMSDEEPETFEIEDPILEPEMQQVVTGTSVTVGKKRRSNEAEGTDVYSAQEATKAATAGLPRSSETDEACFSDDDGSSDLELLQLEMKHKALGQEIHQRKVAQATANKKTCNKMSKSARGRSSGSANLKTPANPTSANKNRNEKNNRQSSQYLTPPTVCNSTASLPSQEPSGLQCLLSNVVDSRKLPSFYREANKNILIFQADSQSDEYGGNRFIQGQVGLKCRHCPNYTRFPRTLHGDRSDHGNSVVGCVEDIANRHLQKSIATGGCEKVSNEYKQTLRHSRPTYNDEASHEVYGRALEKEGVFESRDPQVGRCLFLQNVHLPPTDALQVSKLKSAEGRTKKGNEGSLNGRAFRTNSRHQQHTTAPPVHRLMNGYHPPSGSNAHGWYSVISLDSDANNTSPYHCFLREQIQAFELLPMHMARIESKYSDKAHRPIVGQVGLRCRHCGKCEKFPRSLKAVISHAKAIDEHLLKETACPSFPSADRVKLAYLKNSTTHQGFHSHDNILFYQMSFASLGVKEVSYDGTPRLFRGDSL